MSVSNRRQLIDSTFALDVSGASGDISDYVLSPFRSDGAILVLDRIDPAQNMARYYVLSIEPALFDQVALVREWGRSGKPGGRRIELHANSRKARVALEAWLSRKMKRGYQHRTAK
jgi:predicted DNA-binding WGR domain protein